MRIVSLHHEVPSGRLEEYFKRGSKDRHRLLPIILKPFAVS